MRAALLGLACALAGCAHAPGPAAAPKAPEAPAWQRTPPPPPLAPVEAESPPRNEIHLANGLRVVVIEHHSRPTVSVRLFLPVGSTVESDEHAGITRIALALLLARYEKRDDEGELIDYQEKSARSLMAEKGASLLSEVGPDLSWVGIDGYAADTSKYLAQLDAVIRAQRHGQDGFAAQRDAVLDAIDDRELGDDATLAEHLAQLAFGKNHVYARRVMGTGLSMGKLGHEDVGDWQAAILQPQGATLLVVGDVDRGAVFSRAGQVFGRWRATQPLQVAKVAAPQASKRSAIEVIPRRPARTTALCAARSVGERDAGDPAMQVLSWILQHERLWWAVRERAGLTYDSQAVYARRRKARALFICTRLATNRTDEGLGIFMRTLDEVRKSGVTAPEVEEAKAQLIALTRAEEDDNDGSLAVFARGLELGDERTAAQRIEQLRRVTAEQVSAAAAKVLEPDWLQLVLTGEPETIQAAVRAQKLGKTTVVNVAHE